MKVWIDLANSPHPLLFAPIARRLEELGHEVLVTARDNAQTVELTRERWPEGEVIGGPSPRARAGKTTALACRVAALAQWARRRRPAIALSHNSYAQIAAARLAGIPAVTAMDYEHQPANHFAFRLARLVLLPRALAPTRVSRQGATSAKTRFYDGLKEELYLGDFHPDPNVLGRLGIARPPGAVLVVARTPPSGATYHRGDNPLFFRALRAVAGDGVRCIVLPRRDEQRRAVVSLGLPGVVVPRAAVDSRSLLYEADLVLGAGGTMTREAALLGVPTISLFTGEPAAVDRWLEERGLLRRVARAEDLPEIGPRSGPPGDPSALRRRGDTLIGEVVEAALEAVRR